MKLFKDAKEKILHYYDSNGVIKGNFVNNIKGKAVKVKTHMGGNYGLADQYLVYTETGICMVTYYGDGSANVKPVKMAKPVEQYAIIDCKKCGGAQGLETYFQRQEKTIIIQTCEDCGNSEMLNNG